MDTVIVAFESDSLCRKFRDLLEGSGSAACLICHSGSQVRRAAAAQPIYCVVCGTRLSDGPAEWLCGDLPPFCSLLMVGPAHQLALCSDPDIFKLPTPIRREEALREMEADPVIMDVLGGHVASHYIHGKMKEWNEYCIRVSNWELEKYLVTY